MAFVVAMILSPPDVFSQIFLAIPLCLLYELGLFCAGIMVKKQAH
jgi:sec-independent protein translocase protein TatC